MHSTHILQTLKSELKVAKVTYRDLARKLRISEAGVKKIFSRDDISLERAIEICNVLNIPFSEAVSKSEGPNQSELRFTHKQIQFFKSNISYFHFYMKLAYEQQTPLEIQSESKLSGKSLSLYLKKLEDLGLIKRHPKDRAQIIGGIPLAVGTGGTELESVKFDITLDLLNHIKTSTDGAVFGAGLHLTQDQSEELTQKLMELMNTFSIISNANRRNKKSKARPLSIMMLRAPRTMFTKVREI